MNKLIVAYIGDNCSDFLRISFDSIINIADKIVFIWGMEEDATRDIILEYQQKYPDKIISFNSRYDHYDSKMNGRQRNYYLKYLQENFNGDFCLVLDPDEIVENGENFKKHIEEINKRELDVVLGNIKMRHLIGDLGHEDNTLAVHFVQNRFFRINDKYLFYPEIEHPVLSLEPNGEHINAGMMYITNVTIWHLAHAKPIFYIKDRYLNHLEKSDMHTPQFLKWWYYAHLFGTYPIKEINPKNLPKEVKEHFMIDDNYFTQDYEYYKRNTYTQAKHQIDVTKWHDYFKPKKVLDLGCGSGARVHIFRIKGCEATGIEINKWIIDNNPFGVGKEQLKIINGDITNKDLMNLIKDNEYDLVIAYDVLEHLDLDKLDSTLDSIYRIGSKNFIFSMPFVSMFDLYLDDSHKIFWTRYQWENKLKEHGFVLKQVPEHFDYKGQLFIAEK